MGTSSQADQPA